MSNPEAAGITSLISKIAESEKQLEQYEREREKLKEDVLVESSINPNDPELVLENLDKLRKDGFRKAKLAKKRAILKDAIKSIHIHPENAIRVDFWGSKFQDDLEREKSLQELGVVLPFHKLGKPLAASFRRYASKGDGYETARRNAGLGIVVLASEAIPLGVLGVVGSCGVANGRTDWI